ncbi:MAG: hypothetical protein ACMG6S_17295 [Byssovorax sp.]
MLEINLGLLSGGLKEQKRRDLARRFEVSQELILRYERARSAYRILSEEWRHKARLEAALQIRARGEDCEPEKLADEMEVIIERLEAEQKENPICRELDEAAAAIRAVVDAPKKSELN